MQITSLLVSACLALSATVDAIEPFDIVPAVQKRLNSLDLGYTRTHNLLQNFGNPLVSPEFVYQIYNQTVATGTQDLGLAQPVVIDPTTQLILCQAYHNVAISGIQLNAAFVQYSSHFNKTLRNEFQKKFAVVRKDTKKFVKTVGEPSLGYCVDSIRADNELILATLDDAVTGLNPSKAPK